MSTKPEERPQVVVHVERLEDAPEAVARAHRARRGEKETDDGDWLHMRLLGEDRARLKRILGRMLVADELGENESISFAGAARYAFRRCLDLAPAETAGG